MCFKNCKEASPPGAEREGLSSWEGEERWEKDVTGDGLEREQRARSCWAWMVMVTTRDLDFMQRLEATIKI